MMNNILKSTILALGCLPALSSCDDGFGQASDIAANVTITLPDDIDVSSVTDASVSFYNISNGTTTTVAAAVPTMAGIAVLPGLYNISYTATATLPTGVKADVRAQLQNVSVTAAGQQLALKAFAIVPTNDLIISEMFFTGTLQTSGNQYNGDQYIKLYNNSDRTVYADGISIVESKFLTTQKFNFTPDIMAEAMSIDAVYVIPGSGNDYPVLPGQEILIADIAIDHRSINPNSFDLSHADFEWYDESNNPKYTDIDNASVPNLDKWYCYTNTVWLLHNRGFKAYAVARIPVDKDKYLAEYRYDYTYDNVTAAGTFPMSASCYKLPNEWITDVVTLSVEAEFQWNVTAPQIDMGWTHCGTIDGDKNRYFHAVRRRVETVMPDGRVVLCKTNNSSHDFEPMATPSEIEAQATVNSSN